MKPMTRPLAAALVAATMMTPVGALVAGPHGYGGDVARFGSCTGVLICVPPDQPGASYERADQTIGTCYIDSGDEAKVLRACTVGRFCKITFIQALTRAADRGVKVRIYLDGRGE